MKERIKQVGRNVVVYRDTITGIAFVENGIAGLIHSCHSNIDSTGSVKGMKDQGYWNKDDRTVRSHGYIYNIDTFIPRTELDFVAAKYCQCESCSKKDEKI